MHLRVVALVVLSPLASPALVGQSRYEVTPFVGLYAPLSDRIVRTDTVVTPTQVTVRHRPGPALGARVALWTPAGLGFESSVAVAFGDLHARAGPPANTSSTGDGTLVVATGRVLAPVATSSVTTRFHVLGGVSLVAHRGDWSNWKRGTDVGAVFGLTTTVHLGGLTLRAALEDHIFAASFEGSATTGVTSSRLQSDVLVSVGVAL
jgi:hypothetical protein